MNEINTMQLKRNNLDTWNWIGEEDKVFSVKLASICSITE